MPRGYERGVDSSVAALLLAQAGWACTGVMLRLYAGADAAPDGAAPAARWRMWRTRAPWHDGWASGTTPLISQKLLNGM
ncbi:MAG: hypothetical protein ACLRZH_13650 [Ruthenibacterium lactatiformans]